MMRNVRKMLQLGCRAHSLKHSHVNLSSTVLRQPAVVSHARLIHFWNRQQSMDHASSFYDRYVFPEPPAMISYDEHSKVIEKVNEIIEEPGRLFAFVVVGGHQLRITNGDLIRIPGQIPAECGEQIRLEKVCLVGGKEFTLVGKPVLPRKLVKVLATVIEKTPGEDIVIKKYIRRKRHEKTYQYNATYSILRINEILLTDQLK